MTNIDDVVARLTLLEDALTEISKMTGCEIEAASEFAKAVLERSLTYREWLSELQFEKFLAYQEWLSEHRAESQKKPVV